MPSCSTVLDGFVTRPGQYSESVSATWHYDPARPVEIRVTFLAASVPDSPVVWVFARDLLAAALAPGGGYGGSGDVVLDSRSRDGRLTVRLLGDTAEVSLPIFPLRQFLAETERLCPIGREVVTITDADLAALLNTGAD